MPAKSTTNLDGLPAAIAARFDEAQRSLANHKKNCVALHKLHLQAVEVKSRRRNEDILEGEVAFGDAFTDMITRTLPMKKGAFADRIIRFVGSYIKMMNDKVLENRTSKDDEEETFASRFVTRLLEWLFQGFKSKNKMIRQRAIQLVIEMMSNIGEIDESTYNHLRDNLIERLCDKEPLVRAHAAIGLSKLVGTEDPEEIRKGEKTCLDLLLECVQYDTAPEVRRAALINLPVTAETLPIIITRTRDTDTLTRKLAYSSVLEPKLGHPRHLTIAQREDITKVGLGDREAVVRVAAGKMITKWLDIAMSEPDPPGLPSHTWAGDDGGIMKGFISFLAYFDVVGPGEVIAVDAMLSVFTTRPALLDAFIFSDDFWADLSPESAVLARVFVDKCIEAKSENRLEEASIPVVTAFAFHIQEAYNAMLSLMQEMDFLHVGEPDDEESEAKEEELAKKELILGELLRIALKLDYMDEIGRRKVFSVVRDMLAHPHLPPGLIEYCLDVLSKILPSERELIRIVVEIIIELRDDDDVEAAIDDNFDGSRSDITQSSRKERSMRRTKNRDDMTAEEQQESDLIDIRCLVLCIGMLERVNGTFEDNSTLEGVLTDLIVPAVKRKELALREKGLIALGLCCLIARNMAINSFQLFLNQVQTAPEELKLKVLQIVFDLLIMYERDFLGRSEIISQQIISFLIQTLDSEESPAIQCVLCIGMCKLLLSGQVTDSKVLLSLVVTYFSPTTMYNSELKQCLSYFFPVYCYSSRENQNRMRSIFIDAFNIITRIHDDLEDDQKEDPKLVSLHQFGLLMVDWMDMTKLADKVPQPKPTDRNPHAELALDLLMALYDSERSDESRKAFVQILSQLQLFPSKEAGSKLNNRTILKLHILIENLQEQCPFDDASLDRTFKRFKDRFRNAFGKRLVDIDPGRYVDAEFEKFYEDIGMEVPEATGDDEPAREELSVEAVRSIGRSGADKEEEKEEEEEKGSDVGEPREAGEEEEEEEKGSDVGEPREAGEEEEEEEEKEEEKEETDDEEKEEEDEEENPARATNETEDEEDAELHEDEDEEQELQPIKSKTQSRSGPGKSKSQPDKRSNRAKANGVEDQTSRAPSRASGRASRKPTTKPNSKENQGVTSRAKRQSGKKEEDSAGSSAGAGGSVIITSPMKKAGKRTRASQREHSTEPGEGSAAPQSPIRKKRVGGGARSRSKWTEVEVEVGEESDQHEHERDASPSPSPQPRSNLKSKSKSKPQAAPKRGRGSRTVKTAVREDASESDSVEEESGDEMVEPAEEEEEEEDVQRQPDPSPSPEPRTTTRPRTTRNGRVATRSRGSGEGSTSTTKAKAKVNEKRSSKQGIRPVGKENAGASRTKGRVRRERTTEGTRNSMESAKSNGNGTRTRTRTRSTGRGRKEESQEDGEVEEDEMDSDI